MALSVSHCVTNGANKCKPGYRKQFQGIDGFGFRRQYVFPLDTAAPPDANSGLFAAPSSHFTIRSRSFQPSPVEGVPPRAPNLDFGRCVQRAERRTPLRRKVEFYQPKKITMTYMEQLEAELHDKLNYGNDEEAIIRWISEKVLESYRNGIKAGQKGAQVIRDGKSRRRPLPPQAR
jgi:hypothetical protein